jgi:WD40 repeat protein
MPPDHDGGITCLAPLPPLNYHHRFLSGGVDGTIQLWTIPDTSNALNANPKGKEELNPRLVKRFVGHRGYVHQIARLGWFDPKLKKSEEGSEVSYDAQSFSTIESSCKKGRRKRDLFVSASRDNTLRIWELDGEYVESDNDSRISGGTSEKTMDGKNDLSTKGKKMRGHIFGGTQTSQGVLCVCAVPSLTSSGWLAHDTAGQFVSGGSDGIVRVWDVRSALSLERVPKSGVYSTVQIQCLEKDRISVLKDAEEESESEEEEDGDGKERQRRRKNKNAIPITSVICCGRTVDTVSLFAADASGIIRRYSPKNKSSIGYVNNSLYWEHSGYFTSGSSPVTSLTILQSPDLAKLVYKRDYAGKKATLLASASADGCIRVWDASDVHLNAKLDASDTQYSHIHRKKMKREALLTLRLNDKESYDEEERGANKAKNNIPERLISVTSIATILGRRLIAGTSDGCIHILDVSTRQFEGSYNFGSNIQVWSVSVVSEAEYQAGDEKIGVGVIVSGDNRGRLRALKNVSSQFPKDETVAEKMDHSEYKESVYDEGQRLYEASHRSGSYREERSIRSKLREVNFG